MKSNDNVKTNETKIRILFRLQSNPISSHIITKKRLIKVHSNNLPPNVIERPAINKIITLENIRVISSDFLKFITMFTWLSHIVYFVI